VESFFNERLKQAERGNLQSRAGVDRVILTRADIDLALGLMERDLGPGKAREIARMMARHHRRAGGQSQHSALLDLDIEVRSDRVQAVLQYARRNLSDNLSVERLAAVACLGLRQFGRVFRLETGVSTRPLLLNSSTDNSAKSKLMLCT
jgi:transcriptional regulator GlxA family with amidase domain